MRQLNDQKRNSNREQIEEVQRSSNFSFRAAKRDPVDEQEPRGSQHGGNTEGNNEEKRLESTKGKEVAFHPYSENA
ncbi:hypothetical protein RDI58_001045 [Solanum bulbocastanum]|uniref:Uncharacterized protein n=1 Tax=Solanum bulbocastanum TaxID=147425 RepID=A0AAN8UC16_SOLBU